MKLSPRLTRAGLAFLVFGMLASTLPSGNGLVYAANCPAPPVGGGGGGNTGAVIGAIAAGGGLFALSRTGGGLFPYAPGKKKKKKRNYQEEQFNKLDRFTRPSDAGSNPAINH